ncbi:vitamin K epoxide reductase family protein [Candidatus Uhrbacteria bacterium]|nr:vitamin K epoxide reductase family protein [Candidatus Uhrbacteria bacterium]
MPAYILIIFIGFGGFLLSLYIAHKKRRKTEPFICPLRASCVEVVHSDYGKFLGINVEYLGILYYATIAIGYGFRTTLPIWTQSFSAGLLLLSVFALVFSFYLTFIQIFTLRKLCTWCLVSAFLCLTIFLTSFIASFSIVVPFLSRAHETILIFNVIGLALGLGAATIADIFFFKFLKDFRISSLEAGVLNTFSQIIWVALGIMFMMELGLFIPNMGALSSSPEFLLKVIVLSVIILNGSFLNLFVAPQFVKIQFHEPHLHEPGELLRTRQIAFVLGPISLVSWYTALFLTMRPTLHFSFEFLLQIYATSLIVAVIIGQIVERRLVKKAHHSQSV